MLIRSYQRRDFDDCDWLQRSFYARPATQEELRGKLENPSWVAVTEDDEVVGNIITCPYWSNGNECVLIWSIVVAAALRGQGIGGKLMDAAESFHRGTKLVLHVEPTNRAAQFYRRRGYQDVHFWPNFYGTGEAAIEMCYENKVAG